jgi:hypothetical protein
MSAVAKPVLMINISETGADEYTTIPYTTSPLDTFRGGKGFQAQRKKDNSIGNGKKNKKTSEGEKSYDRH